MTKKNRLVLTTITWLITAWLTSSCSTMTPARYSVSVDANQALKSMTNVRVYLANLSPPKDEDSNCRLMGPIKAGDGLTITEFIQKAFNDEFKFADRFDQTGVRLEGEVTEIEFSSIDGITNGHWALALTLSSSNGHSMSANVDYRFKSGFDAITACNQTADALGAAVQDLVVRTVTDPQFKQLVNP
jgi:hypothetical protein